MITKFKNNIIAKLFYIFFGIVLLFQNLEAGEKSSPQKDELIFFENSPIYFTFIWSASEDDLPPKAHFSEEGLPPNINIQVMTRSGVSVKRRNIPRTGDDRDEYDRMADLKKAISESKEREKTKGDPKKKKKVIDFKFTYDLGEFYQPKPGQYIAVISKGNTVLSKQPFRICKQKLLSKKEILRKISSRTDFMNPCQTAAHIQIQVSLAKTTDLKNNLFYLQINKKQKGSTFPLPADFAPILLPKNSELINVDIDYRGNLWYHIKDGEKESVSTLNLINGYKKKIVPWTKEKIEFFSFEPKIDFGQEIQPCFIGAGIKGKTLHSSTSLGFEDGSVQMWR